MFLTAERTRVWKGVALGLAVVVAVSLYPVWFVATRVTDR